MHSGWDTHWVRQLIIADHLAHLFTTRGNFSVANLTCMFCKEKRDSIYSTIFKYKFHCECIHLHTRILLAAAMTRAHFRTAISNVDIVQSPGLLLVKWSLLKPSETCSLRPEKHRLGIYCAGLVISNHKIQMVNGVYYNIILPCISWDG